MMTGSTLVASESSQPVESVLPGAGSHPVQAVADDEQALVSALRAGHEWAFEAMIRVYGGRLLSVARRFMRNDEDACDVVQSAYLSAFQALDEFKGACKLSTWLHRIVVNTALMRLRSRRRKPEESNDRLLPALHVSPLGHPEALLWAEADRRVTGHHGFLRVTWVRL